MRYTEKASSGDIRIKKDMEDQNVLNIGRKMEVYLEFSNYNDMKESSKQLVA